MGRCVYVCEEEKWCTEVGKSYVSSGLLSMCLCVSIYIDAHAHTHAHIYRHTHTYTHICIYIDTHKKDFIIKIYRYVNVCVRFRVGDACRCTGE